MADDNLIALLERLNVSSENNDRDLGDQIEKLINDIHKESDSSNLCQELVNGGILPTIAKALQNGCNEGQAKAAELVAELAKIEDCRLSCIIGGVVPMLVEKMSSEDTATALQACRALGNICYEHDGGRVCVMECGGSGQLLNLLKRAADLPHSPENHQLRLVSTGFLLNLLNSYDTVQEHPMDALLVDILCHYLDKYAEDEDIPTHVLLSLSCMADTEVGLHLVISKDISSQLVKVFSLNNSAEVIETCLELVTNLAETECVKTQLACGGVCQSVIEIVKKHLDSPSPELSQPIVKTSADLVVLILVGDESMSIVYCNGEGPVYQEIVNWLTSPLEELQIAGALCMGNFARSDAHCINMVKCGIAEKMIKVLKLHNTIDGDIRLQHALLSALRNLSIAQVNKSILIKQGALDVLLPLAATIETFPVVFKLLATLRMIIDGQPNAAIKVGEDADVLRRIVSWCNTVDHPGVQGEASRILSWIVKNCAGSESVINSLVEVCALYHLVMMLGSEHTVMVNEAALALALIFAKKSDARLMESLKDVPLIAKMNAVLRNSCPDEVLCNVLSALAALNTSDATRPLIEDDDLKSTLKGFSSHTNEDVKRLTKSLVL